MSELTAIEIRAFVPAKDFTLSKSFYQDIGFVVAWSDADLAYKSCGECSFLLQNFYEPEHAAHFMMHRRQQRLSWPLQPSGPSP